MYPINRRAFGSRVVASTVGMLAAASASSKLLAAPAKTWRVAVIGHTGRGNYGHGLDVMWRKIPSAEVVAIADANEAGLAAAQKRLPNAKGFSDYTMMLNTVRPEIVAVAPRYVDQHHAMCMAAIAAGARGIYVEKPFCQSPREADEIVAACETKNVKLAVAHRNRYHGALPIIKQLLANGEIGPLLEIRSRGKEDHRGGSQDLWVLGCHLVNLAEYFAGPAIACSGMLYQDGRPCTSDDLRVGDEGIGTIAGNEVHARFEMTSGTPLFFDSIQNHGNTDAGFGLQLIGTEGIVDLRIDREPLAHFQRGNPHNPWLPDRRWLPITTAGIDQPEPIANLSTQIASHQAAGEDLIASIEQDRPPLCDAAAGRSTIEMICAVFASHLRGGQRVEIPLTQREHPLASIR